MVNDDIIYIGRIKSKQILVTCSNETCSMLEHNIIRL